MKTAAYYLYIWVIVGNLKFFSLVWQVNQKFTALSLGIVFESVFFQYVMQFLFLLYWGVLCWAINV